MTNFLSPRFPGPDHGRLITWLTLVLVTLGYLSGISRAQTAVVFSPLPIQQLFDQNGRPLAFGCVFSYQVASSTPLSTYTDYTGTTLNANPVILSASGTYSMWLQAGVAYTLVVKSAGGTNCSSGSTISVVNGIGGGSTILTVNVPYSPTPSFLVSAQTELFTILLTGNASAQPLTFVGITPPSIIFFQITQDASGGHTFSWPANSVGGCVIGSAANQVTTQEFVYNGTNATAVGPCVTGTGPAIAAGSILDSGLTPSLPICTDANSFLTSTCTGLIPIADLTFDSVTYNGQTVVLGTTGNVNAGDAAHSIALNEGDGNPLGAAALTSDQIAVGVTSADPVAKSLCTGVLNYNTSTHTLGCYVEQWVSTMGCTSSGSICTVTTNWPASFADTSYFVECTPTSQAAASAAVFWISTKSTGSFVISISNVGTNNPGGFNSFDCLGHHN